MKYIMFISFKETVTASVLIYIILQELISNYKLLNTLLNVIYADTIRFKEINIMMR